MLDPIEQAKGGFRAQVAREQERRDHLADVRQEEAAAAAGPADAAARADGQVEGAPPPELPGTDGGHGADAPPTGREPKRWR